MAPREGGELRIMVLAAPRAPASLRGCDVAKPSGDKNHAKNK